MRLYLISIPMLFIYAAAAAQGLPSTLVTVPQVATSAVGEVRVVPDRATIFIGVESRAATAAAASAANARQMRAVMDAVRALGIGAPQMSTSEYSVYPEQVFEPRHRLREDRIKGAVLDVLRQEHRGGESREQPCKNPHRPERHVFQHLELLLKGEFHRECRAADHRDREDQQKVENLQPHELEQRV